MTKRDELFEQGFTRFSGVLSDDLLNRLRDVTDRILEAQDEANKAALRSQGSMFHTTEDAVFADLITLPAALSAIQELGFERPTFSDGYVISKQPHGPRLFWHYDWFAWDDDRSYELPPPQIFLMYYLTETRRENGCLRAIPGSHIHENPLHSLLAEPHSKALGQINDADRPEFTDRPDEVDVPVTAGELLVGDARLLHAAHENQTDERRTLITLWYQPDLESLPERMQAQMAAKSQRVPESWPAEAREKLLPLMAYTRYTGNAEPYPRTLWKRRT